VDWTTEAIPTAEKVVAGPAGSQHNLSSRGGGERKENRGLSDHAC